MQELISLRPASRQVLLRIEKKTQETCVALERMRPAQLPQTIDWSDNKPIRFIDAFDRKITLAYEWCETWPVPVRSGKRNQVRASQYIRHFVQHYVQASAASQKACGSKAIRLKSWTKTMEPY